jgi:branched-subunit amino acid transport protein
MSWWSVLALCGAAYALKAAGLLLAGRVQGDAVVRGSLELVVLPVLAALIVVQTLDGGRQIVLDARLPALAVAALLVWRRAPLLVIVLAAGATAAALRVAGLH